MSKRLTPSEMYWKEKTLLMMEEYNPKLLKKLKQEGTLEETLISLAISAEEQEDKTLNRLCETNYAQIQFQTENPTPDQVSTAMLNNLTTARETAEQTLLARLSQ